MRFHSSLQRSRRLAQSHEPSLNVGNNMNTVLTNRSSREPSKAVRLAEATIKRSNEKAKRSEQKRRELASMEARARDEGVLDDEGFFTQSTEDFMAETGLSFRGSDLMGF